MMECQYRSGRCGTFTCHIAETYRESAECHSSECSVPLGMASPGQTSNSRDRSGVHMPLNRNQTEDLELFDVSITDRVCLNGLTCETSSIAQRFPLRDVLPREPGVHRGPLASNRQSFPFCAGISRVSAPFRCRLCVRAPFTLWHVIEWQWALDLSLLRHFVGETERLRELAFDVSNRHYRIWCLCHDSGSWAAVAIHVWDFPHGVSAASQNAA
jgi:hypothetical protein